MTVDQFAARALRMRNEDLIKIASSADSDGFEVGAIEAARAEIERRGLQAEELETLQLEVEEDRTAEANRPNVPLSPGWRTMFLIFAPFVWTWIGAVILASRGYKQKSSDAWKFILFGFLLYGLIAGGLSLLDRA